MRNGALRPSPAVRLPSTGPTTEPTRNPVENISWDRPAPSGIYEVEVNLFSVCAVPSPGEVIPFTLFITRAGQPAQEILGEVSASSPTFSYSMELP